MTCITIQIHANLEDAFRKLAKEKFGDRRGIISKTAAEALDLWLWLKQEDNRHKE